MGGSDERRFFSNEKWWRHRIIVVGVVAVLLYGLLVVITGVTGKYRMHSYRCYETPANVVEFCNNMDKVRLEVFPIAFLWVFAMMFGFVGLDTSYTRDPLPPAFIVHIINATFYFLTGVWFSGFFEWGRRSNRKAAWALLILCSLLPVLLVWIWMTYACIEPY